MDVKTLALAKSTAITINQTAVSVGIKSVTSLNGVLSFTLYDNTTLSVAMTGLSDTNYTSAEKSKVLSLNDTLLNKFSYVNGVLYFDGQVVNESIDISKYYTKLEADVLFSDRYTKLETLSKAEITALVNSVAKGMNWKDSVANMAALPMIGNAKADTRVVLDTSTMYTWNGTKWVDLGGSASMPFASTILDGKMSKEDKAKLDSIVLANLATVSQMNAGLATKLEALNIKQGSNISVNIVGNDVIISSTSVTDLSTFTTDDLKESSTKKYITPAQVADINNAISGVSTLQTDITKVKTDLTNAVAGIHTHGNKPDLDKIGEDSNGHLTYDGNPVGGMSDADKLKVDKLVFTGTGLNYLNDQGDYVPVEAGFKLEEWIPGDLYDVGKYVFYEGRMFKSLVSTSNNVFDNDEWMSLSGSVYCKVLNDRPTVGIIGILYIIESDSAYTGDTTIYVWDTSLNDYRLISGGTSGPAGTDDKQVLISPTDINAGFLEDKIIGTTGKITFVKKNPAGNEQLQIGLSTSIFDKTVDTADNVVQGTTNKFYQTSLAKDDIGGSLLDTATVDFTYDTTARTIKADVKQNTSTQKIEVAKNGGLRGTRKTINFIEGANASITVTEDNTNDKLDIMIASTAESNTASNTGASGIGLFSKKDVYDLQFKKIDSVNSKLLITDDIVNGIVKLQIDDSKLTINGSQIPDLATAIANDGNVAGLLTKAHTHTNYTILNDLSDVGGKLSYKGHDIGDVIMSSIDSNLDGIVDKAATLDGMTVDVSKINMLQGLTGNVQDKFNALGSGVHYGGTEATKATLDARISPIGGTFIIVLADETHGGGRSQYIYNDVTHIWEYNGTFGGTTRDFTTTPINVVTESTGIIAEPRIDALIARKTDLPSIANKSVLDKITDVAGVLNYNNVPIFNNSMAIDDSVVVTTKTWSSSKINSAVGQVGVKNVNELGRGDKKFLIYDALSDKLVYTRMFAPDWLQLTDYEKGNLVWYDGNMYRCNITNTSGILFDNDLAYWTQIGGGGGSNGVAALRTVSGQVNIAANDSVYMHLNVGFNKYDLRTLYAKSLQDEDLVIEIYNKTNSGFMVYQSLETPEIHDILMTPCEDLDSTKCIHVKIFNKGTSSTDVQYLFYITSLS